MKGKTYILFHVSEDVNPSLESLKIIGIYDTEVGAREAMARVARSPGFEQAPELRNPLTEDATAQKAGFYIDPYIVNQDYWAEGF